MFGPTFDDYYRKALEEAKQSILREPDSRILDSTADDVSNHIFQNFALKPLEFEPSELSYDIKKEIRRVPAHQRESFYSSGGDIDWEYEVAVISIPIKQNSNLDWIKKLGTGTWTSDGFENAVAYDTHEISFSFDTKWYGSRMDEDRIASEINSKSERLLQNLNEKNNCIISENDKFLRAIKTAVEERRAKLTSDKTTLDALSQKIKIPIKQKVIPPTLMINVEDTIHATAIPGSPKRKSTNEKFDVFISHASEDKKSFVEPLAQALREAGLSVWYDDFQLGWGDSLRQSIERGLTGSKYGIVVLSKSFLAKKTWTEHELDGLFAKETNRKKVILPIWHDVSRSDVLAYSPLLADRLAKSSGKDGVAGIVSELKKLIGK